MKGKGSWKRTVVEKGYFRRHLRPSGWIEVDFRGSDEDEKQPRRSAEVQHPSGRSAGVIGFSAESDPKQEEKIGRRHGRMTAATQIAEAKEPFTGERQTDQKPLHQQTIGVMVGDVFQAITVFAIVEAVIFNAPASLTKAKQTFGAELGSGDIGQPVPLADLAIRVTRGNAKPEPRSSAACPGIKVIAIPEFHPVFPSWKMRAGGLSSKRARACA
jgi:hypothetical protein